MIFKESRLPDHDEERIEVCCVVIVAGSSIWCTAGGEEEEEDERQCRRGVSVIQTRRGFERWRVSVQK